ncbi:nitroreductase/quinone reductase family protein [Geodermatophilus africanus]|uniref:nitroreductase/quinone reductase family protein n=1 Tax=Geodermatophilus africanus TaxID=1137993 RepID=UPI000B846530
MSNRRGRGALHLTTVGRWSCQESSVIIGHLEDGADLVALAMNGWDERQPAWWLNLQAHPDAVVRLVGQGRRPGRARAATGDERNRLWHRWPAVEPQLDAGVPWSRSGRRTGRTGSRPTPGRRGSPPRSGGGNPRAGRPARARAGAARGDRRRRGVRRPAPGARSCG